MQPTIRLRFRPLRPEDEAACIEYLSDFETARLLARVPQPYHGSDFQAFLQSLGQDEEQAFAITLRDSDELIGIISYFWRDEGKRHGRLGYWLGQPFRRQGLMREAVLGFLAYGFDDLGLETVRSGYFKDNVGSAGLQAQIGFKFVAETDELCLATGEIRPHIDTELHADSFRASYPAG